MEEAVQLDVAEVRRAEVAELVGAVLAHMPGVVRALGARRRERQHVRRRDEHDPARREHRLEVLEHRVGGADVLDGLQEHDRVAGLGVDLHHAALEAQVRCAVAQPGVLERVGVGLDPDDRRRARGEHGRAVALAARHVDHAEARDLPGHPLVDGEVAAEPVVLLGDVRERALAVERERRDSGRLVALDVELRGHGRAGPPQATGAP
jgi:hypothetical protein